MFDFGSNAEIADFLRDADLIDRKSEETK